MTQKRQASRIAKFFISKVFHILIDVHHGVKGDLNNQVGNHHIAFVLHIKFFSLIKAASFQSP